MKCLVCRVAVGLLALTTAALGQESSSMPSLSSGCYWTSTVITYDASMTFTSMTQPSISPSGGSIPESPATSSGNTPGLEPTINTSAGSTSYSTMPSMSSFSSGQASPTIGTSTVVISPSLGTTTGTVTSAVPSPATTSASPTPVIEPGDPFVITVNTGTKRAILYVAFDESGLSVLVDDISLAALFVVDDAGNLLSGGSYVGTATGDEQGSSALALFTEPPAIPYQWDVAGGTVTFGNATFCSFPGGDFYIVFDAEAPQGCTDVAVAVEATSSEATSSSSIPPEPMTSSSTKVVPPPSPPTSRPSTLPATSPATPTRSSSTTPANPPPASTSTRASSVTTVFPPPPISSSETSSSSVSTNSPLPGSSSTYSSLVVSASSSTKSSSPLSVMQSSSMTSSSARGSSSTSSVAPVPTFESSTSPSAVSTSDTVPSPSATQLTSPTNVVSSPATSSSVAPTTNTRTTRTTTTTPRASCVVGTRTILKPLATRYPLTGKRGLPYDNITTLQYYKTPTQVSWAYDYFRYPNDTGKNMGPFPPPGLPLRFYPLVFNDQIDINNWINGVADAVNLYNADAIFSFNEPDLCADSKSACMSVSRAIAGWLKYMEPFKDCGLKLIAPSIGNAGASLPWLRQFMGNATELGYTVHALNMHHYGYPYGNSGVQFFKNYTLDVHAVAPNLPVWVTEYGLDTANLNAPEQNVLEYIQGTLTYAEFTDWIPKIAWFGNYNKNLLNEDGSGLSARGSLYSTFNP